jgi:hypothetical protein
LSYRLSDTPRTFLLTDDSVVSYVSRATFCLFRRISTVLSRLGSGADNAGDTMFGLGFPNVGQAGKPAPQQSSLSHMHRAVPTPSVIGEVR